MSSNKPIGLVHLLIIPIFMFLTVINAVEQKNFYIVYMGDLPSTKEAAVQTHIDVLSTLKGSSTAAKNAMVHSYTSSFNAFAAKLSQEEATRLSSMDGVLSVFPNRYHKLHTTKSWDFLGFPQSVKRNLKMEGNVIVGLIDTGITPESESFSDEGLGPPPANWKGTCGPFANFSGCNHKIIGAKYFKLDNNADPADIQSPIDVDGHGTHTSSTLAGNIVENASLYDLAKGTARGAVPSARIAMYKVCWATMGCADMDILAAFDAAIHDGVDILSISIGGFASDYPSDSIAIGSFHAMKNGILTCASAGNDGPSSFSLVNHAPWLITVAASGTNRQFRSKFMLGNGKILSGIGVNTFASKQRFYPLVSGANVAKDSTVDSRYCSEGTLDPVKVKGKLVYCELNTWGADSVVKGIGGIGTILESEVALDAAQIFMTPATMVNATVGIAINDYINSTRSPSAVVYKTQEVNVLAPFVASFSSRGPNPGSKLVLKPDIAAPGIDILASYTPLKTLTGLKGDTQYSKFTLMSGTSMACPHIAGTAAYIKSFHPSWSPAAVKSAIITTARPMSSKLNPDSEFAYGAGQVNPAQAAHPGLIYDMNELSYIQFLCHEGYHGHSLAVIVGKKHINCSSLPPTHGTDALNYPTMQLSLKGYKKPTIGVFLRRVTNVGPPKSIYNATIHANKDLFITVKPTTLSFTRTYQRRSFKVVVKAKPLSDTQMISASLVWRSFRHTVRSPIVVYNPNA